MLFYFHWYSESILLFQLIFKYIVLLSLVFRKYFTATTDIVLLSLVFRKYFTASTDIQIYCLAFIGIQKVFYRFNYHLKILSYFYQYSKSILLLQLIFKNVILLSLVFRKYFTASTTI